jgi:glycosyltransferase involved in cell wall biosynthesis
MAVARHYRSLGHKVVFITSCHVLLDLAEKEGFETEKVWLYKPPVTFWSLIMFTLLSPILFFHASGIITRLKLKDRKAVFYMLSFTEKLVMTPFLKATLTPVIWLEHARIGNWFWKNPWKKWYIKWASFVKVVTVSERMVQDLGVKDVILIPNAIKNSYFSKIRDAEVLPESLKAYFLPAQLEIGYVGRLTEDKGMNLVIEAAKKLPNLNFVAVGEGPMAGALKKAGVNVHNKIDREQVVAFMQNIDIFILPSTKVDPFGLVVLEAMAAGTPLVLTDQCGVADYLDSGKDAVIASVDDFIDALDKLSRSETKRKKLAEHGQKTVEKKFKYENMMEAYGELIN